MDTKRKNSREEADGVADSAVIECFRCGLCCMRYQPPVTVGEAKKIANALGMEFDDFLVRYVDDSWFEPGIFLIDADSKACVFLEPATDGRPALCRIHKLRPKACRDWQPGLDKKECLEALERDWGLRTGPSGELLGSDEDIGRFRAFLASLN